MIKCNFNGVVENCRVLENMGYQGGYYVKEVMFKGEPRVVIKAGSVWRPKTLEEKLQPMSHITGQSNTKKG